MQRKINMTTPKRDAVVDNLIDLSPSEDYKVVTEEECKTIEGTNDETPEEERQSVSNVAPCVSETTKHYSRLCGYLNKLGNRKVLNTFRKRWFVFNENNCKLYYYRSPHDQVPLGEIDISQATFSFEVDNKERTGLFTVSVPGRDYYLEASSRQACLFWLQELQKYRRANSLYRTKIITDDSSSNELSGRPQSGLLAQILPDANADANANNEASIMTPVDCPTDSIGDDSAAASTNRLSGAQQKLNVIYNQLKTTASFSKYDKTSPNTSPNTPSSKPVHSKENSHSPLKATKSGGGSQQKTKYQNLSALKSKLSSSFHKVHSSSEERSIADDEHSSGKEHCSRCSKLEKEVEKLTDESSNLRDEVTTSREVLSLLQRQLDIASREKDTLVHIYQMNDSDECLKLVSEKDRQIINLTHDLQEQQQEVEKLQRHILSLKSEVTDLEKNNELFQEMLIQKDKTIMALTNEIFDLETERQDERRRSSSESVKSESSSALPERKDDLTMDELKDAVQAFELQNKFLNNELLELNKLRRDSEERVRLMSIKCSEWEARSYQIQSKLLFLLNELQRNDGKNFNKDIVAQLLDEAVGDGTAHTNLIQSWSRGKVYDDLGFNWRWGKDDLSLKASNLKQKSEDMTHKANDTEIVQWRTKWDNFIVSLGAKELQRSQELKSLVRMGVPHEYRGRIWKECSMMWIKHHKASFGPDYYNSLLTSEVYNTKLDPYAKQIELDLLRTLPNNMHYENIDSDGIRKLRRVLLAFSRHNPDIGYCQGLNRLAAIALLFMEEEDAFWCLVAITKKIMPENYYSQTLIGSHVDQKVLKDLMADKLPRLHAHLEQHNVDLSLFTFNWFFTVFVDNIPVDTYLRIWDVFLYEGSKVLFRYALAILKLYENEILQVKDYLSINKCIRSISDHIIDSKKLTHIAFNELNPFSIKTITSKRMQHYPIIENQILELVSIRNSLSRNREKVVTAADYMSEED